jgi:hypothetical protein
MQGDGSPHAVAKEIGTVNPQVPQRSGDIIRHPFEGQWAVNVRGASMCLQLEGDDLSGLGKFWQERAERGADGRKSAVQQREWLSFTVDLIVHHESVHWGVSGLYSCV